MTDPPTMFPSEGATGPGTVALRGAQGGTARACRWVLTVASIGAVLALPSMAAVSQAKLTASDPAVGGSFGGRLAMGGSLAAIGSRNTSANAGRVHLYQRTGDTWIPLFEPDPVYPSARSTFGASVALDGYKLLVGAPGDSPSGINSGSAFVFDLLEGSGSYLVRLTAEDGATNDAFGYAVALDGNTAIVGAPSDDLKGSAYVFVRVGISWIMQAKLYVPGGSLGGRFGESVAISGDTAVGGTRGDGVAYVFVRSGGLWGFLAALTAPDLTAGDGFGWPVSISGDSVLVGAQTDDFGGNRPSSGSAYVFTLSGETWSQQARLTASDWGASPVGYSFGSSLALDADTAIVGALGGTNGLTQGCGAAYVFVRSGSDWTELGKLTDPAGAANDFLGGAVALDNGTAFVGAPGDDDTRLDSGSVWAFTGVVPSAPLALLPGPPFYSTKERPFVASLPRTGGTPPFTFAITSGALPPGVSLDSSTGTLSGTPTEVGRFDAGVTVIDYWGATSEAGIALNTGTLLNLEDGKAALFVPRGGQTLRAMELCGSTMLSVRVRSLPGALSPDAIRLLDPVGDPIDVSFRMRWTKDGVRMKVPIPPLTGRYFLAVNPPDGNYAEVDVKVKAPRKVSGSGTASSEAPLLVTVPCLPGARLTFTARASKGSTASPMILGVTDPAGQSLLPGSRITTGPRATVLRLDGPLPGGDLLIQVGTATGTSGAVTWRGSIRQPKGYPLTLEQTPSGRP